jgi:hypothetical protein
VTVASKRKLKVGDCVDAPGRMGVVPTGFGKVGGKVLSVANGFASIDWGPEVHLGAPTFFALGDLKRTRCQAKRRRR